MLCCQVAVVVDVLEMMTPAGVIDDGEVMGMIVVIIVVMTVMMIVVVVMLVVMMSMLMMSI